MKLEKRNDIAMMDRLNNQITTLTSEVKLLQTDKEIGKIVVDNPKKSWKSLKPGQHAAAYL